MDAGRLAYKDMNSFYYYLVTFIYYILCVLGSVFIPKIDVIIEFVAVICVNFMSFIFPSVFYLTASKNYHSRRVNIIESFSEGMPSKRNKCLELASWGQILLGIVYFIVGFYSNIYGIINGD